MKYFLPLAVTAASLSTVVSAQTERDLDVHDHGAAALNVAVEGNAVFLEFETPWNNLVGFEHKPGDDAQQALVDDALALLGDPEKLFSFSGGDCMVDAVSIESSMGEDAHRDDHHDEDEHHDEKHDDHDKDGHHDEKHDDHAKDGHHDEKHDDHAKDGHHDEKHDDHDKDGHHDEKHDDHAEGEHHDDHAEETHASALVSYAYTCADASGLKKIDVNLFTAWSGMHEVTVQLIGPGGQSLTELSDEQPVLDITAVQ